MDSRPGSDPLEDILKTSAHARELFDRLAHADAKLLLIKGPSGTGKSTFAQSVVALAETSGLKVLRLVGDPARSDEGYYPFKALLRSSRLAEVVDIGTRVITSLAEDFLPMGRSLAKTVTALVGEETKGAIGTNDLSADVCRRFVSMLTRSLRSRRVLIIADDIQYFDRGSLVLLGNCLDFDFEAAGANNSLALLSVMNVDARGEETPMLRRLTATLDVVETSYCKKTEFAAILAGFGLGEVLPGDLVETLYDLSGGHLQVAKAIAQDLKGRPGEKLDVVTRDELLRLVLERRLGRSAHDLSPVLDVLEPAAIIGATFSFEEIGCLTQLDERVVMRSVDAAERMHFVQKDGDTIRFSHEILRDYFAGRISGRRDDYLAKYAECLRILRPGDYFARCLVLLDAHQSDAACVAYCQGQLSEWRSGRCNDEFLPSPKLERVILRGVHGFLAAAKEASGLLNHGDHREAQTVLESIGDGIDPVLRAERDYLLAEALLKNLGAAHTRRALTLLEQHSGLREQEAELWCRISLLLLLANVQVQRYDEAAAVDRTIAAFLSERRKFDRSAEMQLTRLWALSEMHTAAPISRRRLAQACAYHERQLSETGSTDVHEYFICLTNKSGNAITTCHFEEAFDEAVKALGLIQQFRAIDFPARWSPANNLVISAVLGGQADPDVIADQLHDVAERFALSDDDILLHSNVGSLQILSGTFDAALASFERAGGRVVTTAEIDPYYRFLCETNRALALHLSGDASASSQWDASAALIPLLAPAIRADLLARQEALSDLFEMATLGAPAAWDTALPAVAARHPRFDLQRFPRGVFLTDIQIWSSY